MTLAQEKPFKGRTPFRSKMAYEIPTRNPAKAEKAIMKLRNDYDKMSSDEQRQFIELLQQAWRVLVNLTKDKRRYTSVERQQFWTIAKMYTEFKSELRGRR